MAQLSQLIDYQPLAEQWHEGEMAPWGQCLMSQISENLLERRHGDLPRWIAALESLPDLSPSRLELQSSNVTVGQASDTDSGQQAILEQALRQLHPWRKGPFDVFGIQIDTEWRSDWKWDRLADAIAPLGGHRVLDVGCGSGYHCWRMLGAGAAEVIGIDPTPLFVLQFWALQKYIRSPATWVLPLGIDHVPPMLRAFDSVFSMGILYHRRSPIDHLAQLRDCLRPGGQLVLETLVIEGDEQTCLVPSDRYARMGNVWFLPSAKMLLVWLAKLGYREAQVLDITVTSVEEQRSTEWMQFQSLADFLDPSDRSLTIEGYPAPRRALLRAIAPG